MDFEAEKRRLVDVSSYSISYDIHSKSRLAVRNISSEDVEENLRDPKRLAFVRYDKQDRTKRDYYFRMSNSITHRYIVQFDDYNRRVKVLTVIKIRNKWQYKMDRALKK